MTSHLMGPVLLRSEDNPNMVFSVVTNPPAAGPVTLEQVSDPEWQDVLSQWVLEPLSDGVFRIALFPTIGDAAGTLYLTAAGTTTGTALTIAASDASSGQVWSSESSPAGDWLTTPGAPGLEVGFAGDIPVPGSALELVAAHDTHNLGDRFSVSSVLFPAEA